MSLSIRSLIAVGALALATPALAVTAVHFETGGAHPVSFDIAEQPLPVTFVSGSSFILNGVKGIFDGVAGKRSIQFFNNSLNGGFKVAGGPGIVSQQVYIHDESIPFIEVGDYSAQDRTSGVNAGLLIFENGTIGSVPEPAAWLMMIGGFGMVGAMRRTWRRVSLAT